MCMCVHNVEYGMISLGLRIKASSGCIVFLILLFSCIDTDILLWHRYKNYECVVHKQARPSRE